jgi:hypothetical protein
LFLKTQDYTRGKRSLGRHDSSDEHKDSIRICNSVKARKNDKSDLLRGFENQKREGDAKDAKDGARMLRALECIVFVVKFLVLAGVALRGHDESPTSLNPGNFNSLVDTFRLFDEDLDDHAMEFGYQTGIASYMSHHSYKLFIDAWAHLTILRIKDDIYEGLPYFTVMGDESADAGNKEQMSISIRYINKNGFITERFLGLWNVTDTKAETLYEQIAAAIEMYGLKMENIRGQGYDG